MNAGLVLWTLLLLGPLLWVVRLVHQSVQEFVFLLTGHKMLAVYLHQILLFPGVALHELSHYLAASLLGVRVRKMSLRPDVRGTKVQMGAVVIDKPDFVRGLLIGLAPLVTGSIVVVLIGQHIFDVDAVIQAASASDGRGIVQAVQAALRVNDAWIWLYFIFAVSNAMLPSESDREALWSMVIFLAFIFGGIAIAGWGADLATRLTGPTEIVLSMLLMAFGITLFVDVISLGVLSALRGIVSALTGRRLDKV